MQKLWFGILALLSAAALIVSLLWIFYSGSSRTDPAPPAYLLRDNGGKLALYSGNGEELLEEYDIYTRLLPQDDGLALERGIPIWDRESLEAILEDYGL